MASTSEKQGVQIEIGHVFREESTHRYMMVTGFGCGGDETTVQLASIGQGKGERWSGEFSRQIFLERFTGPLPISVG